MTKTKNQKTNEELQVLSYKGITGKLGKKQKLAVDALETVIRETLVLPENTRVTLKGKYDRVMTVADENDHQVFDFWNLSSIYILVTSNGGGHGYVWHDNDVEAGNVLLAATHVLRTYGCKVKKVNDEEVIDDHADAKNALQHALQLPYANTIRNYLYYLLWAEHKLKGVHLSELLATRPEGFYGRTLKEQLIPLIDSMSTDRCRTLDDVYAHARTIKPLRIFQLEFEGYDSSNSYSHHLLKKVAVMPSVLQMWLKEHDLAKFLSKSPIDLVQQEKVASKHDTVMRDALTLPVSKGGAHATIEYDKDSGKFNYGLVKPGVDPAFDWVQEVNNFRVEEQKRLDDVYRNTKEYERVEEEIAGTGESYYKNELIEAKSSGGYKTQCCEDKFRNLLDAMRAIDASKYIPQKEEVKKESKPKKTPKPKKAKVLKADKQSNEPQLTDDKFTEPIVEQPQEEPHPVTWSDDLPVQLSEMLQRDNIPLERAKEFFRETKDVIDLSAAIRKCLLTTEQDETLDKLNVSINDILTQNYSKDQETTEQINKILNQWNTALGEHIFVLA